MLLLLLLGAGISTPVVDGVRAYARTSYSNAGDAASAFTTVTDSADTLSIITSADNSEE